MQGLSKSITELPEMLVLEIPSKLPIKSLTRFKCVCKPWASLFQTLYFIAKHQQNNLKNDNHNLLLKRCHGNTHDVIHHFSQLSIEKGQNFRVENNINLPFFQNYWYEPLVDGPCNGILCLHDAGKASFWNPSTRKFKILPRSTVQRTPTIDSTNLVGNTDRLILSFDMVNETFSTLPLPKFGGTLA
ncbi:Detected protein of unknown function [Hibiscus syriacus]|uniref:F-box domain-containing protein n=1 Tax=Hibiscus syriacus TaxID=106335 RepID=A0A6A3CRJ9_HIBSY|nr:Detected protein of unknown function [Hibiscus syriacus]